MRNSLASVWISRRSKPIWRFVAEQARTRDRYLAQLLSEDRPVLLAADDILRDDLP
jgi:hypothetical protein